MIKAEAINKALKNIDELEAMAKLMLNNCSRVRQELAQFTGPVPAGKKNKGLSKEESAVFMLNYKKRFDKKKAS